MEVGAAFCSLLSLALLLLASAPLSPTSALSLPSYFKPCAKSDPNFNACALKSGLEVIPNILNGDRKYNVPPLNPVKVNEVRVRPPDGSVGLGIVFKDLSISGFKDVVLKETIFNLDKNEAVIKLRVPVCGIVGQYEVDGRVLLLPIKGSGDTNITLVDLDLAVRVHWELEKRDDGKEYVKPLKSEIKFEMSRAHIYLDGLFGGDKTLGDNMNKFMNENWQEVVKEIGPALAEAMSSVVTQILSGITHLVPYSEVFPEKV